jgi:hypothetical protein
MVLRSQGDGWSVEKCRKGSELKPDGVGSRRKDLS